MALVAGTKLGPYEVVAPLGAGGMGEVYRARDTRLDRDVAIKILPDAMTRDADRIARFEREAKLLASLNHTNIGAIHGFESAEARKFLVLEFVEGETLAQRQKAGAFPVDEALEIAKQIAEALEAAHEKGIVHRDLKPGNVMVRPDGTVKVLDFGLARAISDEPSSMSMMRESPTITSPVRVMSPTISGVIMGTAGYMSPEQARGKPVDKRSDIFSFGCVLYEMLTGLQPFRGETVTDSLGATLHREVDWSLLPPGLPPSIQRLLRRMMAKNRDQRLHDIADARIELAELNSGSPESTPVAESVAVRNPRRISGQLAILVLGIAGTLFAVRTLSPPRSATIVFASIEPLPGMTIIATGDNSGPAVISPDGRLIVFTGRDGGGTQSLWLRSLDQARPESLRGTEGATFPFWSPDSRSVGYFAEGKLRRIDLATRAIRTLCDAPGGRGGAWLDTNDILFTPAFQAGIERVSADGGVAKPVTTVDLVQHTSHRWPSAIRGTDRFVYLAVSHDPSKREGVGVFIASLDGSLHKPLVTTTFGAQVVGDRLLFVRENTLLAASIDPTAGVLQSEPVPVLTDVTGDASTWHARFSASDSGALVYHPTTSLESAAADPSPEAGLGQSTRALVVDRTGRVTSTFADGMLQGTLAASPDGIKVAISGRWPNETGAASYDIWLFTLFGPGTDWEKRVFVPSSVTEPRRFTFMAGDEVSPAWSPDGKSLAFGKVFGAEPLGLFVKPVDGGAESLLLRVGANEPPIVPTHWTPDGRYIIVHRGPFILTGTGDILAIPAVGGDLIDLVEGTGKETSGTISNDNKWLAYDTWESGVPEVFVTPFMPGWEGERAEGKPLPDPNERFRVSIAGGSSPVWGRNTRKLYYCSSSNSLVGVNWATNGTRFTYDAGQAYFDFLQAPSSFFDAMPTDGDFVVNSTLAPSNDKLRLVLNWTSLLKR